VKPATVTFLLANALTALMIIWMIRWKDDNAEP
jgi:hypothetical protein